MVIERLPRYRWMILSSEMFFENVNKLFPNNEAFVVDIGVDVSVWDGKPLTQGLAVVTMYSADNKISLTHFENK